MSIWYLLEPKICEVIDWTICGGIVLLGTYCLWGSI